MLSSFPVAIFAGVLLGYLAGLGVGGGSLLILWLTLVLGMDSGTASTINLMFFITAAGAVCIFRWKNGTLHFKKILPAIIAGSICAALVCLLARQIDSGLIEKLFGGLLILIGLRELCYRPRKAK
jgi:uncharacterized membrane protein YfcA